MQEPNIEEVKTSDTKRSKAQGVGVPYPIENIDDVLSFAKSIVEEYGSSRPISKEEIARTLKKKINSLSLFFSTLSQYGIFSVVHGKGYLPSDLYRKYTEPIHDNDENKAKLLMFQSAPLYAKIIENINNHTLPADEKRFANLLKSEPYNVNSNSAEKASKIFFENCRILNLRDNSGKFKFPDPNAKPNQHDTEQEQPSKHKNQHENQIKSNLISFPIHLPGDSDRTAIFNYPKSLTKRDFKIIAKALTFIASTLISDEENEDYELKIIVKEEGKDKE